MNSLKSAIILGLITCLGGPLSKAFALDKSDFSFLKENNMLDWEVRLHSEDEWEVSEPKESEFKAYRGQGRSLVKWDDLDANKWLDFNHWKEQRSKLDKMDNWRKELRDLSHSEIVGKVIQCLRNCRSLTGEGGAKVQYGSKLKEGDEFRTGVDSYAWIYLVDGSIMRVSPESSISFIEVNISQKSVYLAARLNYGHIYSQSRRVGKFKTRDLAETDLALYPLFLKNANRENFARMEYQNIREDLKNLYNLERNPGHVGQYRELNRLIAQDAKEFQRLDSDFFLFTPNASFSFKNANFHVFYETMGKTWVKMPYLNDFMDEDSRKVSGEAGRRGHVNKTMSSMELGRWYQMDKEGANFVPRRAPKRFDILEHFVKRVPSVQIAREIYLREMSLFLKEKVTPKELAKNYGYRLWDQKKELDKRAWYVKEYVRRVETTNLKSMKKVFANASPKGLTPSYYSEALKRSIDSLKDLRDIDMAKVRETTEAEYYLWILKHGKEFLPSYFR